MMYSDFSVLTVEEDKHGIGAQPKHFAICERGGYVDLVGVTRKMEPGQTYPDADAGSYNPLVPSVEVKLVLPALAMGKPFTVSANLVRLMSEVERAGFVAVGLLKRVDEPNVHVIPAHENAGRAARETLAAMAAKPGAAKDCAL